MATGGLPSRFGPELDVAAGLRAKVRASIAATPAPKVRTRTRIGLALAAIPVLSMSVELCASRLVFDRRAVRFDLVWPGTPRLLLALAAMAALAVWATLVVVRRGRPGLGAGALTLVAVSTLVAPLDAGLTLWAPVHSEATTSRALGLSPWGLPCLFVATVVGALVLAALTAALRRAAPAASRLRGAAVGACAGAWAALSVFVFCPAADLAHLLVGHVLPLAAFSAVGWIVVPPALRP